VGDPDPGCASAVADDNARTTDNLSIPPFLDRTNDAPTAWSNLARELEQKLAATNAGAQ